MRGFVLGAICAAIVYVAVFGFISTIEGNIAPAYVVQVHANMDAWRRTQQGTIDGTAFESQVDKEYAAVFKKNNLKLVYSTDVLIEVLETVALICFIIVTVLAFLGLIMVQVAYGLAEFNNLRESLRKLVVEKE